VQKDIKIFFHSAQLSKFAVIMVFYPHQKESSELFSSLAVQNICSHGKEIEGTSKSLQSFALDGQRRAF
jgi:hypothetical protein